MCKWNYTLRSGKQLRESIGADNYEAILNSLLQCWDEIEHMNRNLPSCDMYIIEVEDLLEGISNDALIVDSDIDILLDELYDYCDDNRIWVGI